MTVFKSATAVCAAALLAGGCSVREMALGELANTLTNTGGAFSSDDDPELVRNAVPFGLKTMEIMLTDMPRHRGLLLALCSGFTEYAYAFVQDDADEIEPQDLAKATAFLLSYPALTMLASWLLGRESIHALQVAGLIVTLAGAGWLSRITLRAHASTLKLSEPPQPRAARAAAWFLRDPRI